MKRRADERSTLSAQGRNALPVPLLYWRKGSKASLLNASPFKSEQEFEQTVFEVPAVLGDIYLLKRQIRGGSKPGIPDIVGIDREGTVCVIEVKNTVLDAGVIPQVLRYAIWAEANPDSIKALWLLAPDRPDDLAVNWEEYSVRILVIAPSIDRSTLEYVTKIDYSVDLIEVARWSEGKQSWLLVNTLKAVPNRRIKPVSGLEHYGPSEYKRLFDPKSVPGFLKACKAIQRLTQKNNWPVESKFNKSYFGCKVGNYVVFGVKWFNRRSYGLFFKVPEPYARKAKVSGYEMQRYEKGWHQALYPVIGDDLHLGRFQPLFRQALRQRMEE